jgi:hypothetical protein
MSIDDSIDQYTWSQPFNPFIAPAVAQPLYLHPQLPAYAAAPAARPVLNVVLPAFRPTRPAAWFCAVEDVLRLCGVTDQRDQFAFAYAKL